MTIEVDEPPGCSTQARQLSLRFRGSIWRPR